MKKLALLACLLVACDQRRAGSRPPAQDGVKPVLHSTVEEDPDADNLLNLAYGAAVVSRTGELNLENSAAHAIDNITTSAWISSPGAPDETLVFSLLAPSKITRVGLTVSPGDQVPRRVAFDASIDGKAWRELLAVEPHNGGSRQLWPVAATVARYLRVRSLEKERYYVRVRSVHALGDEVAPPTTPPFTGCWTVNGRRAEVVQEGARITGTIDFDPPLHFEGGTDNRVALVTWQQGPTWGYAALTRTPDGAHLTGVRFYEEFNVLHLADAWFGERCDGAAAAATARKPFGGRSGRRSTFPVYGLAFDGRGRLIEPLSRPALDALVPLLSTSQRIRITSRELRYDTPEENRRQTAARIQSLRAALQARGVNVGRVHFVAAGSEWTGPVIHSTLQRFLASRVEISFGT